MRCLTTAHPAPRDGRFDLRTSTVAGWLLLVVAALGCGHTAELSGGIHVTDDAGSAVVLAHPASRIVSLSPATTEVLFAIGAGSRVIGRTPWCDYPPAALKVPIAGDGINPNLEQLVALHPDLVLLYPSSANATAAQRLSKLGIPVFQARTDRIEDVPRLAAVLGRLTGFAAGADSLERAFAAQLDSATVPAPANPPGVFMLVWDQPPMTVGRGSYLTELIQRAGARNIFDDIAASSAPISLEAVARRDPDLILTTNATGDPGFARRPEWQAVEAVRQHRFVVIHGSEFDHPGPRTPLAIRELAARLAEAAR
jgi:ABC-type Fe3+-hydroxamate transport system substrate-binding protein